MKQETIVFYDLFFTLLFFFISFLLSKETYYVRVANSMINLAINEMNNIGFIKWER